ncbi:hypothetical protein MAM1_0224d08314 [Mucor ambiguus]|uniref:Uncharacterized protein n=1 Tax=Mucor ambiguus TaxID=91626 RepID=A0A0C9N2J9_9FUNG|nr:hypothetical protein MAM1_0224d08314 [Mucor ambiguus]
MLFRNPNDALIIAVRRLGYTGPEVMYCADLNIVIYASPTRAPAPFHISHSFFNIFSPQLVYMAHHQRIKQELPRLLNSTSVYCFDNCMELSQDQDTSAHLKHQAAYDLYALTGLLNRDCWKVITDFLFAQHSKTMYSIIKQISPTYRTAMLPFLTAASPIDKQLLVKMAHEMEINLILHKAQMCPEFVVRLEQFHIDIIHVESEATWVISTSTVDCLAVHDHMGKLLQLIDDAAVYVDPVDIQHEFLLTLNTVTDGSEFSDSFIHMAYNFYYDGGTIRTSTPTFNLPLESWGGPKAIVSARQISLEMLIAQFVKISTSINGILYLVRQDERCYCCITRFPNERFFICVIHPGGNISMPPFDHDMLLTYQKRKTSYFIDKWGQQLLN